MRAIPLEAAVGRDARTLSETAGFHTGRLLRLIAKWRRRRRSRGELATLDHRMLRDIGLTPADVWLEINKPFWRE